MKKLIEVCYRCGGKEIFSKCFVCLRETCISCGTHKLSNWVCHYCSEREDVKKIIKKVNSEYWALSKRMESSLKRLSRRVKIKK